MVTELKTSRQGSVVPFTIIEGPEDWRAADFPELEDAILHLTPEYVSELDAAVATAESLISEGKKLQDISLDDVSADLPTLSPALLEAGREAQWGRGWSVLRGVPVGRYSRQQQLAAYWVLGLHWGRAVPQNAKGHLIGHIKDLGRDPNDPSTRLYGTNAAQPWHNDGPADLVSLLCLSNSEEGGESGWSSSIAVHNEILRRAPHLASVLAGPWFFDRKNEIPDGEAEGGALGVEGCV
ncbi:hypothetical protein HYH03_005676 [Edaphochlamys debaryana]|uniref:TauD/TfdA-like domain-containing protein n=1 Tax=Edaphochlamys debaryana TaxID=47281 RepID=A0A836C240_9CHLO|nr:hypothetical protein HYH03_005676 [Edaphochlamys debaryana]|eukprot:KAG2496452.1 hypothetical protein HYH03_005676 [Edaphochlamys debaryana]